MGPEEWFSWYLLWPQGILLIGASSFTFFIFFIVASSFSFAAYHTFISTYMYPWYSCNCHLFRRQKAVTVDPMVFACVAMMSRAIGPKISKEVKDLLEPMLSVGLR